jgi:protein-disulfide isomerase
MVRLTLLTLVFSVALAAQLSPLDAPKAADPPTVAPPSNALDKSDLEYYVRHLYVYGPQISIDIPDFKDSAPPGLLETTISASFQQQTREHTFYATADGQHLIEGAVYEIAANPFKKANERINTMAAPTFGKEGASVVVVAYSDFQCPYCAQEAKLLRNQLQTEYGDRVRVYFRDFPLPMHAWAMDAAIAGRCAYVREPETFWSYHDWIFKSQKTITPENFAAKAAQWASENGIDSLAFAQCVGNRETLAQVEESMAEARELGVTSTPTLFVNGRKLAGSQQWPRLKGVIDYELEYQKVTNNAGDNCGCEAEASFPE